MQLFMIDSLLERLRNRLKSVTKKTVIVSAAIVTGIAAVIGGGAYYLPYQTIGNIKNAAADRNAEALSQEIDFPELRASIKENVKVQVFKQLAGNNISQISKTTPDLVGKTIDSMVDKLVTPEGLARVMLDKVPDAKIDLSNLDKDIAKSKITMGYESLDRFVVHITDKVDRSKDVSLILKRDGLAWKLSGIDIAKV
jgi:Protein of unknown function (DUF2939)